MRPLQSVRPYVRCLEDRKRPLACYSAPAQVCVGYQYSKCSLPQAATRKVLRAETAITFNWVCGSDVLNALAKSKSLLHGAPEFPTLVRIRFVGLALNDIGRPGRRHRNPF